MAQGIFIAEVTSDSTAYGKDAKSRLKSIGSLIGGGGAVPIGTVEWQAAGDPTLPPVTGFAAPLLPWSTSIPIEGEYIMVIASPSPNQTSDDSVQESFFYLGPVNIDGDKNLNKAKGFMNRSSSPSPTTPSIPSISVKNVPPVQPLIGDTIFQDRNGSVIRMSSTQKSSNLGSINIGTGAQLPFTRTGFPPPPFANAYVPGQAGNPIMMLTVGIPGDTTGARKLGQFTGLSTAAEQPEKDRSFIYLTSDQNIEFRHPRGGFINNADKQPLGNEKSFSIDGINTSGESSTALRNVEVYKYKNPAAGFVDFQKVIQYPLTPPPIAVSQIIIGSDRVNISAKRDSVLIGSARDVKIGTKEWRVEMSSTMDLLLEFMQQTMILAQHVEGLAKHLDDTINQVKIMQFPTGVGPTGPTLTTYFNAFEAIQTQLKGDAKKLNGSGGSGGTRKNIATRIEQFNQVLEEFIKMKRPDREKQKDEKERG